MIQNEKIEKTNFDKNLRGRESEVLKRKIGILCASDTELEPFFSYVGVEKTTEKAMLKFYEGNIGDIDVVAAYSGVCKVNAAIAAQIMIVSFGAEALLNVGTAGGMDPRVHVFDTVIANKMVYHDVAEDILTQFHPWLKENCFLADAALLEAAERYDRKMKEAGAPGRRLFGTVATGEQFIEDEKREEICGVFSPFSADMETTAIAQVCYAYRIPFLSVRTVTDDARHSGMENFEKNCAAASEIAAAAAVGILNEFKKC